MGRLRINEAREEGSIQMSNAWHWSVYFFPEATSVLEMVTNKAQADQILITGKVLLNDEGAPWSEPR